MAIHTALHDVKSRAVVVYLHLAIRCRHVVEVCRAHALYLAAVYLQLINRIIVFSAFYRLESYVPCHQLSLVAALRHQTHLRVQS